MHIIYFRYNIFRTVTLIILMFSEQSVKIVVLSYKTETINFAEK